MEDEAVDAGKHGRVRFVEDSRDTARFRLTLPARAPGSVKHVHPRQIEILEALEGHLAVWHEGNTHTLEPGESIEVPAGDTHTFWNPDDQEILLAGEVTPPLQTPEFMMKVFGLLRRYPATEGGIPFNLLCVAPILDDYPDHLYLASPPIPLQKKIDSGHRHTRTAPRLRRPQLP